MAIQFARYTAEHVAAVQRFNSRMRAGGVAEVFLLEDQPGTPPPPPVWSERILAIENGEVRGGYLIQWRDYYVAGQTRRLGNYQTPISEGIIEKKYTAFAVVMLRHALSTNPLLYTVGMGGIERPLPRMLAGTGWHVSLVPFRFRVHRPAKFFREIRRLRTSAARRAALDTLAWSGAGWLGIRGMELMRAFPSHPAAGVRTEPVEEFGAWADELWEKEKAAFPFAAVRTAAHLNALYPREKPYRRFRVFRGSKLIGWMVLLSQRMKESSNFGNMSAGVLVDCFAAPSDLASVGAAASRELHRMDVDFSFANPVHAGLLEGLRRSGYLSGPTNYGLGLSKQLAGLLGPAETALPSSHLMRGDGDGLSNFGSEH